MHPNRHQSADLSLSSACRSNIEGLSDSPAKQRPEAGNRLPNQIDDITFVEPLALESSFLSSKRQRAVAALPPVLFNVSDRHLNNTFDREFLKVTLGKPIAARSVLSFVIFGHFILTFALSLSLESSGNQTIASYLCPTLNHHPWCPSRIGNHGFMFVGLGKDKSSYQSAAIRNLFVGLPKTMMENRRFRYLGKYKVTRVDPLSVDEWALLSADVSAASHVHEFCNLTVFPFSSSPYMLSSRRIKPKIIGPWKISVLPTITAIFVFRVFSYSVSALMTTFLQLCYPKGTRDHRYHNLAYTRITYLYIMFKPFSAEDGPNTPRSFLDLGGDDPLLHSFLSHSFQIPKFIGSFFHSI